MVVKEHPYIPLTDVFHPQMSLNNEDIINMKAWGVTLIRLGLMWEAVETAPGVFNYTYLDEIDKLVNNLG